MLFMCGAKENSEKNKIEYKCFTITVKYRPIDIIIFFFFRFQGFDEIKVISLRGWWSWIGMVG